MSRIIVSSDWHDDAVTRGVSRRKEIRDAVWQSVNHAIARDADAYVFAGDLCDPDDGPTVAVASEFAVEVARHLSSHKIPSYWITGNHDTIENGRDTSLSPLRGLNDPNIVVAERPMVVGPFAPIVGVGVSWVLLPHTAYGAKEHSVDMLPKLLEYTAGFSSVVIVAHLSVSGMQPGEETTEMPRGRELTLPTHLIAEHQRRHPEQRIIVINGHYHRQTNHAVDGIVVHVPGSLARLTFGEQDHTPSFLDIEIGRGA